MQRVKGNEQDHSLERVEKSAQKKLKTSLTGSALLEMDGNATRALRCRAALDHTYSRTFLGNFAATMISKIGVQLAHAKSSAS